MDCSMPGFPVLHSLLQFAQTHVHWAGDAIQPSQPPPPPSPSALSLSQISSYRYLQVPPIGTSKFYFDLECSGQLLLNIQIENRPKMLLIYQQLCRWQIRQFADANGVDMIRDLTFKNKWVSNSCHFSPSNSILTFLPMIKNKPYKYQKVKEKKIFFEFAFCFVFAVIIETYFQ